MNPKAALQFSLFGWLVVFLALAAVLIFVPLWVPLVLAAWVAHLLSPVLSWSERHLGGRRRVAAGLTTAVLLALLIPTGAVFTSLVTEAVQLGKRLAQSSQGQQALQTLVSDSSHPEPLSNLLQPSKVLGLLQQHGMQAWNWLGQFAGLATELVVGLFVFVLGTYVLMTDGAKGWAWFESHSPLNAQPLERLRLAFYETGRGLLVGMGMTALSQAVVSTILYLILGVPRALVLGLVTFFAAFIPSFGTALVWVPVSAGLALTGRTGAALILAAVGLGLISSIDNLLRPLFSRWGTLNLPFFVLVVAIFGGFSLIGPWGLLLGPLAVRLAREALAIARDQRLWDPSQPLSASGSSQSESVS